MTAGWTIFAAAAAITAVLLSIALHSRWAVAWLDRPNARSLHARPVPRIGGIALWGGALVACGAWLVLGPGCGAGAIAGALACAPDLGLHALGIGAVLAAIFALDDRAGLGIGVRLVTQVAAAGVFVFLGVAAGLPGTPWTFASASGWVLILLILCLALVALVWSMNLYNFMDGSDGMAGTMGVIGFGTYAIIAPAGSATGIVAAAVAGGALGFLVWNRPPARVFMGDSGSVPLGFMAAALGASGTLAGHWDKWLPLAVFAPFVVDATLTLIRRILRGERFWRAHRDHGYQRLVLAGHGHRRVLAIYAGLMIAGAIASGTTCYGQAGVPFSVLTVIICANVAFHWWAVRTSPPHKEK